MCPIPLSHWAARWQVSQSHTVWWVHVSYTTEPLGSQMAGESVSHSEVGACVLYHWAARWQVSQSHTVRWVFVSYTTEPADGR